MMLDAAHQDGHSLFSIQAWRVVFQADGDAPAEGLTEKIAYAEPIATIAVFSSRSWDEIRGEPEIGAAFLLVWIPFEAKTDPVVEQELENWITRAECDAYARPIRASVRTARIVWRNNKALLFCDATHMNAGRAAALRFTVIQRALAHLERQVKTYWPIIESKIELTPQLSRRAQSDRLATSNARVQETMRMKIAFLQLTLTLDRHDLGFTDTEKRLFDTLAESARLHERLEALNDPLDFIYEQCLETNRRAFDFDSSLKEKKYFLIEIVLEIVIIAFLILGLFKNV